MEPGKKPDPDDSGAARDRHRSRVNLIAAVGLGLLLLIAYGTMKLFVDHENLQNCVDAGRRDCVDVGSTPRDGVRVITR